MIENNAIENNRYCLLHHTGRNKMKTNASLPSYPISFFYETMVKILSLHAVQFSVLVDSELKYCLPLLVLLQPVI